MLILKRITLQIVTLLFLTHVTALAQESTGLLREFPFASGESRQETDEIETDRDSFTPATGVVGKNRLVLESAYSFIDNRNVPETHSLPELVARYGISENIELRFGYNYEVGGAGNPVSGWTFCH